MRDDHSKSPLKNEPHNIPVNKQNQSFVEERVESKDVLEEKLKDVKNTYEGRMTGLRDDI